MAGTFQGMLHWEGSRDQDGHRDYTLVSLVKSLYADGPAQAFVAAGLPAIGSTWSMGNDFDDWAFCSPEMRVRPLLSDPEPNNLWIVEQKFSTRPLKRCQSTSIENPLAEPPNISGGFSHYARKTQKDRNGKAIKSSSHEPISIEKGDERPTVIVEQNLAAHGLATLVQMINTLNDSTMWGLGPRKIRLANASWSRKLYGTCSYYYTRRLEFECREEGFDEAEIADTGLKCLKGAWDAAGKVWTPSAGLDKLNPMHFERWKDPNGENMPRFLLDGDGNPLTDPESPVFIPAVEVHGESNFFALGVPASF